MVFGKHRWRAVALVAVVVGTVACSPARPTPNAFPGSPPGSPVAIQGDPSIAENPPAPGTTGAPAATVSKPPPGYNLIASPRGVILPVVAAEGTGFRVSTPCDGEAVTTGKKVDAIDVVLDPGHGGDETGAVAPNGLREKDLNATVSGFAQNTLLKAGIRTIPTRNGDYRMTLAARARLTMAARPKAFVSIHHNAGSTTPSPKPGTDVYYQVSSPEAKRLGGLIWEEVTKMLGAIPGIGWVAGQYSGVQVRINDQGLDYFGVVRMTVGVPGVIVEMGYISNTPEAALFSDRRIQQAEGEAVARGIVRFLRTKDAGTGFVTTPDPKQGPMGGGGGGSQGCSDPQL